MNGRTRILVGEVAQGNAKGKALGDELFKALNQSEKNSTYEKEGVVKHDNKHKK